MKRSERRHLKENELSHALGEAAARLAERRRMIAVAIGLVVVLIAGAVGYWQWRTRTEARAQTLLADAMAIARSDVSLPTPDTNGNVVQTPGTFATPTARTEAALTKFTEVADSYSSTNAGITARYYAGAALAALNRPAEAGKAYQAVVDRAGTRDFYGRMAQLGVIDAHVQAKEYDQAIAKAQALANVEDEVLPRDAMLVELGRAYAAAGKKAEAKETFDKVLAEFPESAYADEVKALLTTLT